MTSAVESRAASNTHTTPDTSSPPERAIPYERVIPWYTRRRNFYLIVFLLILNVIATTSITWGPVALKEFQAALDARQAAKAKAAADAQRAAAHQAALANTQLALAYDLPAGQVVYTDDTTEAEKLLAGGGYATVPVNNFPAIKMPQSPVRMIQPGNLVLLVTPEVSPTEAVIFLHGRSTPQSNKMRLIIGTVVARADYHNRNDNDAQYGTLTMERALHFFVYDSQSVRGEGRRLWALSIDIVRSYDKDLMVMVTDSDKTSKLVQPGDSLRLLAGRHDPADASQWFIDYTLDGWPGTIVARLREDDHIDVDVPGPVRPILLRSDEMRGHMTWQPRSPRPATRFGTDHPTPATGPASTSPVRR